MLRIYVRDQQKYYRLVVTPQWAGRHDNGALISCGLTVGQDGFTRRMLDSAKRRFSWTEVTHEQWNHSGCQSSCILRGDTTCRW